MIIPIRRSNGCTGQWFWQMLTQSQCPRTSFTPTACARHVFAQTFIGSPRDGVGASPWLPLRCGEGANAWWGERLKLIVLLPHFWRKILVDNPQYNRKCDFADLQMGLQKASNRPHREQGDDTTGVSPSKCWKHPITGRAPEPCDDRKPDDLVSS